MAYIGWPELILVISVLAAIIFILLFIYLPYKLFSGLIEKKVRKIVREELEKQRESSVT